MVYPLSDILSATAGEIQSFINKVETSSTGVTNDELSSFVSDLTKRSQALGQALADEEKKIGEGVKLDIDVELEKRLISAITFLRSGPMKTKIEKVAQVPAALFNVLQEIESSVEKLTSKKKETRVEAPERPGQESL